MPQSAARVEGPAGGPKPAVVEALENATGRV